MICVKVRKFNNQSPDIFPSIFSFIQKKGNQSSLLPSNSSLLLTYSIPPSVCLFLSLECRCTLFLFVVFLSCILFFHLSTAFFLSQFCCQSVFVYFCFSYINCMFVRFSFSLSFAHLSLSLGPEFQSQWPPIGSRF